MATESETHRTLEKSKEADMVRAKWKKIIQQNLFQEEEGLFYSSETAD